MRKPTKQPLSLSPLTLSSFTVRPLQVQELRSTEGGVVRCLTLGGSECATRCTSCNIA